MSDTPPSADTSGSSQHAPSDEAGGFEATQSETLGAEPPTRTVLVRDLIVFQVKLWLDGLKDLVLAPLSLAALAIDLLRGASSSDKMQFYRVLHLGERYDRWLNLYGAYTDRVAQQRDGTGDAEAPEPVAGALTASALEARAEQTVDALRRATAADRPTEERENASEGKRSASTPQAKEASEPQRPEKSQTESSTP